MMPLDLWLCRHALASTVERKEHTYNCLDHTFGTGGGKAGLNCSDAPALLKCLQDFKKSIPTRVQEPSLCSSTKSCLGVLGAAAYPSLTTPAPAHRLRCRDCVQKASCKCQSIMGSLLEECVRAQRRCTVREKQHSDLSCRPSGRSSAACLVQPYPVCLSAKCGI